MTSHQVISDSGFPVDSEIRKSYLQEIFMEFGIEIIDMYSIVIKILKVKILCKMYVIALFNKKSL